jgi:hypothetical protein
MRCASPPLSWQRWPFLSWDKASFITGATISIDVGKAAQ